MGPHYHVLRDSVWLFPLRICFALKRKEGLTNRQTRRPRFALRLRDSLGCQHRLRVTSDVGQKAEVKIPGQNLLQYLAASLNRLRSRNLLRDVRKLESAFEKAKPSECYVAFVDLLGFGSRVRLGFKETIDIYKYILVEATILRGHSKDVNLRVFSDAFLITASELAPVVAVVNYLHMSALRNGHLVRGGISFGKHLEASSDSNLYVVSAALVKAVGIEKNVGRPCVVVDPEIKISAEHWGPPGMPNFCRPLIFYENRAIINPCNELWGSSARARVEEMLADLPQYADKYEWFLKLHDAIFSPVPLIPRFAPSPDVSRIPPTR